MAPKKDSSGAPAKKDSASAPPKKDSASAPAKKDNSKKGDSKKEETDTKDVVVASDGKGPGRPNKEQYEKRIDSIEAEIEKKKAEIQGVIENIEKKSTGKESYESQRQSLFEQLKNIKTQKGALIEQRMELIGAAQKDKREARDAKIKLSNLEKEGKSLNEESLDQHIAKLEYKLETGTLTLKEEKAILMQIKKYRQQRPQAIKLTKELEVLKAGAAAGEGSSAPSLSREESIKSLNGHLDKLKSEAQGISDQLDKLKEGRDKQLSNVKPLIESRQKLRDEVSSLISKKKEVVEERKKAFEHWKEHEKKLYEERKKREEEEWSKWRAEQAAVKAQLELEAPNPFVEEVVLLEQTIEYCKGLLPKTSGEVEEKKEVEYNNPEGYVVMKTKKDRNDEMYLEATKGKRGKKGNLKVLDPEGSKAKENDGSTSVKKIKHTAESFAIFKQLNLATPMVVGEVPDLVAKLEEKQRKVNDKVKKWESERLEKVRKAKEAAAKSAKEEEEAEKKEEKKEKKADA